MKKLVVFVLASSMMMLAQGRPAGAGRPAGTGSGGGRPADTGRHPDMGGPDRGAAADMGRKDQATARREQRAAQQQRPLKDSQVKSGAFKMLAEKMGVSEDELKAQYAASGAKNFGEFASAIVVSKNLNLDTSQVLESLRTHSLGETLKDMGVESGKAKSEIKKAQAEVKKAERRKAS